jgi:hypothetical protein
MRVLSKHFPELWLSYACVHNIWCRRRQRMPSANRLSHMGLLFEFASAFS